MDKDPTNNNTNNNYKAWQVESAELPTQATDQSMVDKTTDNLKLTTEKSKDIVTKIKQHRKIIGWSASGLALVAALSLGLSKCQDNYQADTPKPTSDSSVQVETTPPPESQETPTAEVQASLPSQPNLSNDPTKNKIGLEYSDKIDDPVNLDLYLGPYEYSYELFNNNDDKVRDNQRGVVDKDIGDGLTQYQIAKQIGATEYEAFKFKPEEVCSILTNWLVNNGYTIKEECKSRSVDAPYIPSVYPSVVTDYQYACPNSGANIKGVVKIKGQGKGWSTNVTDNTFTDVFLSHKLIKKSELDQLITKERREHICEAYGE